MSWPTLIEIKKQCYISESFNEDDALLNAYSGAARDHISQKLNRKLLDTKEDIETDDKTDEPLEPTDLALDSSAGNSIHVAALLLIAHWYANRESTSALTMKEVPLAFNALLSPYRVINL